MCTHAASYILSDVGLTAYEGAITMLTNYTNIALAAKIIAVEAYHATAVRLKLFESGALPLKPYTTQIVDVAQARPAQHFPTRSLKGMHAAALPYPRQMRLLVACPCVLQEIQLHTE